MTMITPILMSGGVGKRLWPVSRKSFPKQFHDFFSNKTLFQNTLKRVETSKIIKFKSPIIITNQDYRFIVLDQLERIKKSFDKIFLEPSSQNTAPSLLASCLYLYKKNPNSILLMLPTDHLIENFSEFHKVLKKGLYEMDQGNMVIFGIKPNRPETGYGYIKLLNSKNGIFDIDKFVEKPNIKKAKKMYKSEKFLWNAGIILFRAKDLVKAFEVYQKELFQNVSLALENGKKDLSFFRLEKSYWNKCENISIDYAILEKTKNLKVIPFSYEWSDLGDWSSFSNINNKTKNHLTHNITSINCKNTLLQNFSEDIHLAAIGLENLIAVSTKDSILIANKNDAQEVGNLVELLKKKNISQGEQFFKDYRPWGWFEVLSHSNFYKVKKILLYPESSISLQSHKYRSEHWIVVEGVATVKLDNKTFSCKKGNSIFIPVGAKHRLKNKNKTPLIIIEVQTGTYLEEDDIVRYEDNYGRI